MARARLGRHSASAHVSRWVKRMKVRVSTLPDTGRRSAIITVIRPGAPVLNAAPVTQETLSNSNTAYREHDSSDTNIGIIKC